MLAADPTRIRALAERSDGWCVSIYLPTHDVAGKPLGDDLRLKNALRAAEKELVSLGVRHADAAELLDAAVPDELRDPGDPSFHRGGAAVFVADTMHAAYRFPFDEPNLVTVGHRFHLRPMVRALGHQHSFFVLSVTRGEARVWRGDDTCLASVDVPGLPASLDEAIQYDEREKQLLSHSATRGSGGVIAAFHGQGDRADHLPEDLSRYLRMVDAAVGRVIGDEPVVLAGSHDLVPLYRTITNGPRLLDESVIGNPQAMSVDDLHAAAWDIIEASGAQPIRDAAERFGRYNGTGRASGVLETVLRRAVEGRVDTVFVASDRSEWGSAAPDGTITLREGERVAGDDDLLDQIAVDAWMTGADVHVIPEELVPGEGPVAAVFRY